jgi:acetyl esterase
MPGSLTPEGERQVTSGADAFGRSSRSGTVGGVLPDRLSVAAETVQATLLKGLLALPRPALRAAAGRSVTIDGQTLDSETQLVLRLKRVTREPDVEGLPIPEGRVQLVKQARIVAGDQPIGSVSELEVDGEAGSLPARLYVPHENSDALLVFFHGGGWTYGDLDSHDGLCRFLAERAGVRVLSVAYRLAPEAPFPAAYDDATAAYRWAVKNVDALGASADRLAVGGDSAGGALAAATALMAAREGLPLRSQLLIYPATDLTNSMESHARFGTGYYLTTAFKDLARAAYLPSEDLWTDPRASVFYDDVPRDLAPAYLCTAGFDPLRDEGEAYARRLADAGAVVDLQRFPGLIHGFANMVGVGRSGPAAMAEVAAKLAAALR